MSARPFSQACIGLSRISVGSSGSVKRRACSATLSQLSERMAVSGCWRLSVKPMVKATMPTIKAETRKTCDTEPAAGGIARTMTLAPARRDCARCAAPRGNFHGHSVSRQPGEKQRTRFNAIRKRSRSPGHRQLSLAGFLVRGGALRRKGASANLSYTVCVLFFPTRIRHYIEVHSPRGSVGEIVTRSCKSCMGILVVPSLRRDHAVADPPRGCPSHRSGAASVPC